MEDRACPGATETPKTPPDTGTATPTSPALLRWQSCHQATTRGQCEFERAKELQKADEQKWGGKPQTVLMFGLFFFFLPADRFHAGVSDIARGCSSAQAPSR